MLELLKSLVFAVIMVPVVMAIILGLIYGLGEVFNIFPVSVRKTSPDRIIDSPSARSVGRLYFAFQPVFSGNSFSRSCFSCRYFHGVTSNWYQ